jgi:hypothetical protein
MGGLFAGQSGGFGVGPAVFDVTKNGAITKVSANRIAAIMAGLPAADAITVENAVRAIASISASVIGADLNGNGRPDDDEGAEWGAMLPGSGVIDTDALVDGIALILDTAGPLSSILGSKFVKVVNSV